MPRNVYSEINLPITWHTKQRAAVIVDGIERQLYVDLNPVPARLVASALDYPWPSARAHVRGRDPASLLDLALWLEVCPLGYWEGALQ